VSEHALFAMPETGIGIFPDVGGTFFLPRLPGRIGIYLGLTGARLKAADLVYAGLATHYVPRARLDALSAALAGDAEHVDLVLASFAEEPGPAPLAAQRAEIDRLFAAPTVRALLAGLAADGSGFARHAMEVLAGKSPTALALTLRALQEGTRLGFEDCMRLEWRMMSRAPTEMPDFYEGVRAVIIDKDNKPRWSPESLAEVDPKLIERFIEPAPRGELDIY
jgi:enoyl-CoA hydratase